MISNLNLEDSISMATFQRQIGIHGHIRRREEISNVESQVFTPNNMPDEWSGNRTLTAGDVTSGGVTITLPHLSNASNASK